MHSINPSDSFAKILAKLNSSYGFGNIDPSVILNQLRTINFHPSKDPSSVLNEINLRLAELDSAGAFIADTQMVKNIHDVLSGDALRDNFWFQCKSHMAMQKLSTYTVETAGQYIVRYWYSYSLKTKSAETVNLTQSVSKFEKRFCKLCCEAKRNKIMKTHNTENCRIAKNVENEYETANKIGFNYSGSFSNLYHDSGTSTTMIRDGLSKVEIEDLFIPVFTAGASQPPEIANQQGKKMLGGLEISALRVSSFSKNLLSATQLSLEHGCTQIIEPWTSNLKIIKDNKINASGTYDKASKLIKMDAHVETSNKCASKEWTIIHRKLGHVGDKIIRATIKPTTGILVKNRFTVLDCEDCKISKAKRGRVSKGKIINTKDILEVIEIDVQGTFSVIANDGTRSNLKFIDLKSGWLYYTTIPDLHAANVLDHFIKFKDRIERQTGKLIKRVRTDQGTEYMGAFLSYLDVTGIIQEKGIAYTHHHPGKVERSHQTIFSLARSMLRESLLPPKYYNEEQQTATYIFVRTVHGTCNTKPY